MMLSTRYFIFLCILKYIDFTSAVCTVSKYDEGVGNWVKCSNASVKDALEPGGPFVNAITILKSNIPSLEQNSFVKYGKGLSLLHIQNCNVLNIQNNAFAELKFLKKLSLSHNKITELSVGAFESLISLEQLDFQFNSIKYIDGNLFSRLPRLKLLNLDDNQVTCLKPEDLQHLRNLAQIRILENPLSLVCRGRLTLWLKDHGINYSNENPTKKENWLDSILWLCAIQDPVIAASEDEMRRCTVFHMFNQLKSALGSTSDFAVDVNLCQNEVNDFLKSIENMNTKSGNRIKTGQAVETMLYELRNIIMQMN